MFLSLQTACCPSPKAMFRLVIGEPLSAEPEALKSTIVVPARWLQVKLAVGALPPGCVTVMVCVLGAEVPTALVAVSVAVYVPAAE